MANTRMEDSVGKLEKAVEGLTERITSWETRMDGHFDNLERMMKEMRNLMMNETKGKETQTPQTHFREGEFPKQPTPKTTHNPIYSPPHPFHQPYHQYQQSIHHYPHTNPHINPHTYPQNRERYTPQPNQRPNRPHEYIFDGDEKLKERPARVPPVRQDDGKGQGCFQTQDLQKSSTIGVDFKAGLGDNLIKLKMGSVEIGLKEEVHEIETQEEVVKAQGEIAQKDMTGRYIRVVDMGQEKPIGALTQPHCFGSEIPPYLTSSLSKADSSTIAHQSWSTVSDPRSTAAEDADQSSGRPLVSRFPKTGVGDSPNRPRTRRMAVAEEVEGVEPVVTSTGSTITQSTKQIGFVEVWIEAKFILIVLPSCKKFGITASVVRFGFVLVGTAVLGIRNGLSFSAELYLEGPSQHCGYFQSSLLTSSATKGKPPYSSVITQGFVLDEKCLKMSKSLGIVVDPHIVIEGGKHKKEAPGYGTDVLRLWVSSVDYTSDVMIGFQVLRQISDLYRRLRGRLRYLLTNLHDWIVSSSALCNDLPSIDQYALFQLENVEKNIQESSENFQFFKIFQIIQRFAIIDLSNFYFDVAKYRLYVGGGKLTDSLKQKGQVVCVFKSVADCEIMIPHKLLWRTHLDIGMLELQVDDRAAQFSEGSVEHYGMEGDVDSMLLMAAMNFGLPIIIPDFLKIKIHVADGFHGIFDTGQVLTVLKLERNNLEYLLQHFYGVYASNETHFLLYTHDLKKTKLSLMSKEPDNSLDPLREVHTHNGGIGRQQNEKGILTGNSSLHIYGLQGAGWNAYHLAPVARLGDGCDVIARTKEERTGGQEASPSMGISGVIVQTLKEPNRVLGIVLAAEILSEMERSFGMSFVQCRLSWLPP